MTYYVEARVWNDDGPVASMTKDIQAPDPDAAAAEAREQLDGVMVNTGDPTMRYAIVKIRRAN